MADKILEIKEKLLCGTRLEFECDLLEQRDDEVVLLYRLPKTWQLEDVTLPEGALSLGYFWPERGYNAYHFVATDGRTLALYLNISDSTRIAESCLYWRDLIVDILIAPDGQAQVLDEDEIPAGIDVTLLRHIQVTKAQLLARPEALLSDLETRSAGLLEAHQLIDADRH